MATRTLWRPALAPALAEKAPPPGDAVLWIDLDLGASEPQRVAEEVGSDCPGLEPQMLEDMLSPEKLPEGRSYADGAIRLVTSFDVTAARIEEEGAKKQSVQIQPVDLLGSERWLISRWQAKRVFVDGKRRENLREAPAPEVIAGVRRRWQGGTGRGAGDLGILLMHELALRYPPAYRTLYHWLEEWELGLYGEEGERQADPETLRTLWRSMAVMRDWIGPLNKIGMREDIGLAWLPATDAAEVNEVDDRIDRALSSLRELAGTMRASFGLLHAQLEDEAHERTDRLQRQLGYLATLVLIPTLVVGFYGANTYVPGQGKRSGLFVMIGVIVALTLLGLLLFRRYQRREDRR